MYFELISLHWHFTRYPGLYELTYSDGVFHCSWGWLQTCEDPPAFSPVCGSYRCGAWNQILKAGLLWTFSRPLSLHSATMVSGVCSWLCCTGKLHSWKYLHYFHFTFIINHFINQCVCVHVCIWHMCRGTHVETRGKLCAADSSPPTVLWAWGLNSGCQAFQASAFAHWATSSAHKNGGFLFVSVCVSLCACRGQREA